MKRRILFSSVFMVTCLATGWIIFRPTLSNKYCPKGWESRGIQSKYCVPIDDRCNPGEDPAAPGSTYCRPQNDKGVQESWKRCWLRMESIITKEDTSYEINKKFHNACNLRINPSWPNELGAGV